VTRRNKHLPKWLLAAREANAPAAQTDFLSRALVRSGHLTHEEVGEAIALGRVTVNGKTAASPFTPVRQDSQVRLDGHDVSLAAPTVVIAFHKPQGLISHGRDPECIGTVFDGLRLALPEPLNQRSWHAVGRLDRDTTGALLFTNDERFVAHATSPDTHLTKRYLATVGGQVTDSKLATLRNGLTLDDVSYRPAKIEQRGPQQVELTLTEGKHHQVKRMLGAVGLPTLSLHREAIGEYVLDVTLSAARVLSEEEVSGCFGFGSSRQ
jgi:pseudouridine synthase